MRIGIEPLRNRAQTARQMKFLIRKYSHDLKNIYLDKIPLANLPLLRFFDFVRLLPYTKDTRPIEIVARPAISIATSQHGLDCKKKAIIVASWLRENKIPWRLIGMSTQKNKSIHHVFSQGKFTVDGQEEWLNLDATYPHYKPFARKITTKAVLL